MRINTPTSDLDAVNILLASIGEAPVNTLTGSLTTDAEMALNTLIEIAKEVQTEGWFFNTERNYELLPDIETGNIFVPINHISVDLDPALYTAMDVVLRGRRLYNLTDHTYTFTKSVLAEIIVLLPFEEMPEEARRYVTLRAGRVFQDRVVGSETLHKFHLRDEMKARGILVDRQNDVADSNIFNNTSQGILSNWTVGNVLQR